MSAKFYGSPSDIGVMRDWLKAFVGEKISRDKPLRNPTSRAFGNRYFVCFSKTTVQYILFHFSVFDGIRILMLVFPVKTCIDLSGLVLLGLPLQTLISSVFLLGCLKRQEQMLDHSDITWPGVTSWISTVSVWEKKSFSLWNERNITATFFTSWTTCPSSLSNKDVGDWS